MDKPIIKKRIAQWHDVETVLNLLESVGIKGDREMMLNRMRNIFYNPHFTSLVFEIKNKVVGFMTLEKSLTIDITATYLRVVVMAVNKDYMRIGVGHKMLEEAEKIAKEQDTAGIFFLLNEKLDLIGVESFLEKINFKKNISGFVKDF